jgi:hypothetical protein
MYIGTGVSGLVEIFALCTVWYSPRWFNEAVGTALVAAARATIAGWIRRVGQVTAVVMGGEVARLNAPIIDHTTALGPGCRSTASVHGVVVIGDPQAGEARLPGESGLRQQVGWGVSFAGEELADSRTGAMPGRSGLNRD